MRHAVFVVALAALGCVPGCKDRSHSGPMPEPERGPPAGFEDVDTAAPPSPEGSAEAQATIARSASSKPSFSPAEFRELAKLMPELPGDELEALAARPRGRLARGRRCVEATSAGEVASETAAALEQARWSRVSARPGQRDDERHSVTASRSRFRLAVSVVPSRDEECPDDHFLLTYTVHELPPTRAEPASPTTHRGALETAPARALRGGSKK